MPDSARAAHRRRRCRPGASIAPMATISHRQPRKRRRRLSQRCGAYATAAPRATAEQGGRHIAASIWHSRCLTRSQQDPRQIHPRASRQQVGDGERCIRHRFYRPCRAGSKARNSRCKRESSRPEAGRRAAGSAARIDRLATSTRKTIRSIFHLNGSRAERTPRAFPEKPSSELRRLRFDNLRFAVAVDGDLARLLGLGYFAYKVDIGAESILK